MTATAVRNPCRSCGGRESDLLFACPDPDGISEQSFELRRCRVCDLTFVGDLLTPDELSRFYFREYYRRPGKALESAVRFSSGLLYGYRRMKFHAPRPGRVLDVGCGDGGFLAEMKRAGWEASGVETSAAGAELARERGIIVFNRPLTECGLPQKHFDLVTFWQSLEHMDDPGAALEEARRILKDDGRLFIGVPNIASWEFRLFGRRWFHLDLPRHLTHFSPDTVRRFLDRHGFRVTRINHFSWEYNPFGFFQSALNAVSGEMNAVYKLLKGVRPSRGARRLASLSVSALAAPLLGPAALAFSLASAAAGRAGCMEVYAVKDKP